MKLDQLTKKHSVIASLMVITIMVVLTEAPIQGIRNTLLPLTGRSCGATATGGYSSAFF